MSSLHGLCVSLIRSTSNNIFIQLFRYGIVGGLAFIVDFASLYILTEFVGMPYLLSASAGFLAGLAVNYLLSIRWVFNQGNDLAPGARGGEFLIFALIGVVGLGLNALIMWVLTDVMSVNYLISKLCSTIIVFGWNFLARRKLINSTKLWERIISIQS